MCKDTLEDLEREYAGLRNESRYSADGNTTWGQDAHFALSKLIARALFLLARHFIAPAPAGASTTEKAPWRRDWVSCPICDGTDMRREWYSEDDGPYIFCVNVSCPSNVAKDGR